MTEKDKSGEMQSAEADAGQGQAGDTKAGEARPRRGARPCPICSKMSMERYHPFCSRRCADIDLHRWLGGTYSIPAEEPLETLDGPLYPGDDEPD